MTGPEIVPKRHPDAPRIDCFSVMVRLMWIDGVIENDGEINRADISRAFGVSTPQASADLARYREINPNRIAYDPSRKCYVLVEGTKALCSATQQEAAAEMVRQVDAFILRGGGEAMTGPKDEDGVPLKAGDYITFTFGIPPICVTAQLTDGLDGLGVMCIHPADVKPKTTTLKDLTKHYQVWKASKQRVAAALRQLEVKP